LDAHTLHWRQSHADWDRWDKFNSESPRGIYLQSSDWLKSYSSYGFDCKLLLVESSEREIVGGMGVVIASVGPFRVFVSPFGPVLSTDSEVLISKISEEFRKEAKRAGAFLAQLSFPNSEEASPQFDAHLLPLASLSDAFKESKKGSIFKYVTGISGFRAVSLFPKAKQAYELVRENYKPATRRDVNKSARMSHELRFARQAEDIKTAYALIELNAETQGYAVRSWADFGQTLISMIQKGCCFMPCCWNEGELKGTLMVFDVGKKLHYIMGATLREEKDLMVGHFLQDQVIQIGIRKGYDFYDISMGGSTGVVRFKEGFGGDVVRLSEPRYWVLKPIQFSIFRKLLPFVQKNKSKIAGILSKLK